MKFKDSKTVEYFGLNMVVPTWVNYLATDESGDIFCFKNKPHEGTSAWFAPGYCEYVIPIVDLEGLDWRETLREV